MKLLIGFEIVSVDSMADLREPGPILGCMLSKTNDDLVIAYIFFYFKKSAKIRIT